MKEQSPEFSEEEMRTALEMPYLEYMRGLVNMPEDERQRASRLLNAATSLALQRAIESGEGEMREEVYAFAGYIVIDRRHDGTTVMYELKKDSEDKGTMAMLDLAYDEDQEKLGEVVARGYTAVTVW